MSSNKYITMEEIVRVFTAWSYFSLVQVLETTGHSRRPDNEVISKNARDYLREKANQFVPEFDGLGMLASSKTLKKIAYMVDNPASTMGECRELAHELQGRLQDEIASVSCLAIGPEKQKFLTSHDLFGQEVTGAFPSVITDIEEAGKCLAFERWTACVFHLMRVMEVGLRVFGNTLGLSSNTNRTWDAILKKCDDESKKRYEDKSPEWKSDELFYTNATAMLHSVKTAWRNPTMHVESVYTEEQAEDIWNAVKAFMRSLATKLEEDSASNF